MTWWFVVGVVAGLFVLHLLISGPLTRRGLALSRRRTSRLAARDRERARRLGHPVPPPPVHERDGWTDG